MHDRHGKGALVAGARHGIGASKAQTLANFGVHVVVCGAADDLTGTMVDRRDPAIRKRKGWEPKQ